MGISLLGHPKILSFLRKTRLWRNFASAEELLFHLPRFFHKDFWENILRESLLWESKVLGKWKLVSYFDPLYPKLLREIFDPPLVLAVFGPLELLSLDSISIVGTRKASPISKWATQKLVEELSKERRPQIVSGLAVGIDREAFLAAFDQGLSVVGVLGTTLDIEYPPGNRDLYAKIKAGNQHILLTEFLFETEPARWTFPKRNRVIAGLSEQVYILESGKKSGTISTAKTAMDENRELYVFDHPLQWDNSGGKFLLAQGANPFPYSWDEPMRGNSHLTKQMTAEEWYKQRRLDFSKQSDPKLI